MLDTKAPVISVTAPQAGVVVSAPQVTITGTVDEPLTSLAINGGAATLNGNAFEYIMPLAAVDNSALITVTDLAGNIATTTITIQRDATAPKVVITSPLNGLLTNNPQIQLNGTVDDAEAVLTVGGAAVTVTNKTFSVGYLLSEGDNSIQVKGVDKAGNEGVATVAVYLDAKAPVVLLTAPATAAAGANVSISINAGDNRTLTMVELRANGVPIWSVSTSNSGAVTENIGYRISPDLNAGAEVMLQARALDGAGNEGVVTAKILINQAAAGPGFIQGKVLDDIRGLRMEGATVTVIDSKGGIKTAASGSDGGYFFETASGEALLTVSVPGFTTVERRVTVRAEQKVTVLDARLTRIDSVVHLIDGIGGAIVAAETDRVGATRPYLELNIPANALTVQGDLRITPISNQGIAGTLPAGWSPLAVADLRIFDRITTAPLAGVTLAAPATAKISLPSITGTVPSTLILARYDGSAHQWIMSGSATAATDGTNASAEIPMPGQYAVVIPDSASGSTLTASTGQPLPAAPMQLFDFSLTSTGGRVIPEASPPSSGLKAAGEVVITLKPDVTEPPQFTSGLRVLARITEKFDLLSGDKVQPPGYTQDLLLYRHPCITNIGSGAVSRLAAGGVELRSTFPVSPSKDYTIVDLLLGKVGVEITPPENSESGVMVGVDGGRLLDSDGNILLIPQGALSETTPVSTKSVTAATGIVGSDFTFLKAVEINLTRQTLATAATLSIPTPDGFNPSLRIIVAKQITVKGVAKLKLVALAAPNGTFITSLPLPVEITNPSTSINSSGIYYFLQSKGEFGFITGSVTDANGNPFPGAYVKSDIGSLTDLSENSGRYLLAAPLSGFIATATDLYKGDQANGGGVITSANQIVTLNLAIKMIPPSVISITPENGAINVQPSVPVVVAFSKPMDKTTITTQTIQIRDAANSIIPGMLTFNVDNSIVTFYPAESFKQETTYSVNISSTVKDLQGYQPGQGVTSNFTVRKTTAPPQPAAGSISATFPDASGFITITATQGTAPADCTVLLINDTSGEIQSLTPATNGSFSGKVRGQLGDEIKVVIMDYSGNQTTISYLTYKSQDGSYLVTAKGGKIEGDAGSQLDIPDGALLGPAVLKIATVAESALPHPVPAPGKFLGAVTLDSGGMPFQKKVDISLPLPDGFDPGTPVFLTKPVEIVNIDGSTEKVYEIIDSTKIVNGRITTACWPFDGVMGPGVYLFSAFPELTVGIVSGYTYQDMNDQPGFQPTDDGTIEKPTIDKNTKQQIYNYDRPVQGAVIRSAQSWNYVSYSRSNGFYSAFTPYYNNVSYSNCRDYQMVAIHPLTMQRKTIDGNACAPPYNIEKLNFRLAEKGTIPPDRTPPDVAMDIQITSGQPTGVQFVAGTLPLNAKVQIPITVLDQGMGRLTLNIEYRDIAATEYSSVPSPAVNIISTRTETVIKDTAITIYRYDYLPSFNLDDALNNFQVTKAGLYLFTVAATDASGHESKRSIQVRVVEPGELPTGKEGAPVVDEILPKSGVTNVMINSAVTATFSEPVDDKTLTGDSFKLIDTTTNYAQPATVSTTIENGRMKAILTPKGNLAFDRTYEIILTRSIKDISKNVTAADNYLPLDKEYRSRFSTKKPQLYDLASGQFSGGRDIDLFTNPETCGSYAYISAGDKGYRVANISDPKKPTISYRFPTDPTVLTTDINFRSVSVGSEGILAMTDNVVYPEGGQYGYVRFYDIMQDPVNLKSVKNGQEKLAEEMSGIPGRVGVSGNSAYIATISAGLQIVDINAAKEYAKSGRLSDGSTITGVFGEEYGSPSDVISYRPGKAFVASTTGNLISLDLTEPTFPLMMSAGKPDGLSISRIAVATDFIYSASGGTSSSMDLAVTGCKQGKINTLSVSDPYSPSVIGTVTDQKGVEVIRLVREIAINKNSGLAFAVTFDAVLVIDIKDPYNPKLLNEIRMIPGTNTPIGSNMALAQRDGWVYLASENSGMRVMDFYTPPLNAQEVVVTVDSVNNAFTDKDGKTLNDLKVKYTIGPPGYQTNDARVILIENGYEIKSISGATTGTGTVSFPKGMQLKKDAKYDVSVVIDCNNPKVSEWKAVKVNSLGIQDKINPCNKAPGKNYFNGLPALLLSANTDSKATIQLIGGSQKDIVWKIQNPSRTGSFSNPEITIESNGITDEFEVHLFLAIDSNGNGSFDDADEYMTEFKVIVASKVMYGIATAALELGYGGASVTPLRLAESLLSTFMGNGGYAVIQPDGQIVAPLKSTDYRLTHISGANFVPQDPNFDECKAELIEYIYTGPEVSDIIVNSNTISQWYKDSLKGEFDKGNLFEGLISLKEAKKNPGSTGESDDFGTLDHYGDTHLAIGGHVRTRLEGVANIVKDSVKNKLCVESINVSGEIEDLYDWNYFDGGLVGSFAQKAAIIQAGWNSGLNDGNSEKGKLLFTRFKFDKTKELYEYRYDVLGNQYKQYSLCY